MFDFTKDPVCNIATNLLRLAEKKPNGPFDIQVPEQRNKEPNSHQSEMPVVQRLAKGWLMYTEEREEERENKIRKRIAKSLSDV